MQVTLIKKETRGLARVPASLREREREREREVEKKGGIGFAPVEYSRAVGQGA